MTWTRLSDDWAARLRSTEPPLSIPARWHLLELVQECSRTQRWDGTIRRVIAERIGDVDDPITALAELGGAGYLEVLDEQTLRIIDFADRHAPPPNQRPEAIRERKQKALQQGGEVENSSGNSSQNGTGNSSQNGFPWTGQEHLESSPPPAPPTPHPAAVARIGRLLHRHAPEVGTTTRGALRKKLASAERHLITDAVDHAADNGWLTISQDGRIRRGATPA